MIEGNKTIDGIDIEKLTRWSKKKIVKICDNCGIKLIVSYCDLLTSRSKLNHNGKDFCQKCSIKQFIIGDNNSSKRKDVREKISKSTLGRSKKFKDGKNLRILERKIDSRGYVLLWDDEKKKNVTEHKFIMEKRINRELYSREQVHHINGEKKNNNIENLFLCDTNSTHSKIHSQLMSLGFDLLEKDIIRFNKMTGEYYFNPMFEMNLMPISLGFENVGVLQNKGIVKSRLDVDIETEVFRGIKRPIGLLASNMSTVVDSSFIIKLYKLGALGVMHRADVDDVLVKEVKKISRECDVVCASIGIGEEQYFLCKKLVENGANVIFLDVAHGYSQFVIDFGKKIKKEFSNVKLVLGNVINPKIMYEIYDFVDAIKIGIGNGLSCTTKSTAACNEKQFTSIYKFKELSREFGIPLISDGSIREASDYVKSIGGGANSAMAGSIFARCPESSAPIVEVNGFRKKIYAGMASKHVQDEWKGGLKPGTCAEGKVSYLDIGEPVEQLLERYSGALRSGISYSGGNDIKSFQEKVRFTRV